MALPGIYNPAEPQATEAVASGPAKLQQNFQALSDFLGIPTNPSALTAPAFSITTGGVVTLSQPGTLLNADPTVALGAATKQYVDNKALNAFTGTATGTNTYIVTLSPAPASLTALAGVPVYVKFGISNTAASTLNCNALGAVAIQCQGSPLSANMIVAGQYYSLVYDSTTGIFDLQIAAIARAYKSASQTVTNNITLTNDSVLFFNMGTNEAWQFSFLLNATAGANAGLTAAFTVPTSGTVNWAPGSGNTVTSGSGTTAALIGVSGPGSSQFIVVSGIATSAGTIGTCQLQFAQTASVAGASGFNAPSSMVAWRINP